MAVTTVADLNSLFNTIYERALFVAREQNLMTSLVTNRSATGRMARNISIRPQISAVSVAETEDYQNPTTFGKSSVRNLTPGEIIAQATLTDADMETDPDGAVNDLILELGGSIATKIDTDLTGVFANFGTDVGTGAGNAATIAAAAKGVAVLRNAKANQYGMFNAVWHPYHWHDLWVELGQPAATYPSLGEVTTQALRDYFVSNLLGINHYISANIAVDGSDDAVSGIFAQPAIMLDTRRATRLETERKASARATEFNMTAVYAYGLGRTSPEAGVKYTADAATPA